MLKHDKSKKINVLLAGGGTLGSVAPLLAIVEKARQDHLPWTFSFVGTKHGPESRLISEQHGIPYTAIAEAKLRRYFSWRNSIMPLALGAAFWQAVRAIRRHRPAVIVAAGSFVAVPVLWAAKFLRVPSVIYQMDIQPGLANRLMAPIATQIVVAFRHHVYAFERSKTTAIGLLVRPSILKARHAAALTVFGLSDAKPTLLVVGGGTGARMLNQKVEQSLDILTKHIQIIHITGTQKGNARMAKDYYQFDFLGQQMADALAAADVVVARGGLATMSELAALGKPSLIIPLPDSHQEQNAEFLRRHNAAAILSQKGLSVEQFTKAIIRLVEDHHLRKVFSENIKKLYEKDGLDRLIGIINGLAV